MLSKVRNGDVVMEAYTHGLDLSGTLEGAGGIGGILSVTHPSATNATYFYHYDGNGNVVRLTDTNGAGVSTLDYEPFGRVLASPGPYTPRYQFSTKEYDGVVGLNYYGYRYYSPEIGRWISRDPLADKSFRSVRSPSAEHANRLQAAEVLIADFHAGGAHDMALALQRVVNDARTGSQIASLGVGSDTLHLYTYCVNSPWVYVDPYGLMITWKGYCGAACGVLGGALLSKGCVAPGVLCLVAGGALACWEIKDNKELLDKIEDWIKGVNQDSDGDNVPDRNDPDPNDPTY